LLLGWGPLACSFAFLALSGIGLVDSFHLAFVERRRADLSISGSLVHLARSRLERFCFALAFSVAQQGSSCHRGLDHRGRLGWRRDQRAWQERHRMGLRRVAEGSQMDLRASQRMGQTSLQARMIHQTDQMAMLQMDPTQPASAMHRMDHSQAMLATVALQRTNPLESHLR
jgi:hypothetical protein